MMDGIRGWFGFGPAAQGFGGHGHDHGEGGHGHTHGVVDPTIATTTRGIWAIKWSFVLLALTAVLQLVIVFLSGSVALLADTIHNVGDAVTAIPLWIAFMLARRKPSKTFTYGLGRVEDLAGIIIVLIILFSAIVAGYEAIDRLIHPQAISFLGWVAAAGLVGFLGNEAVAVFRIRVGREINSAALIADGYHARTDGFTSLAVVRRGRRLARLPARGPDHRPFDHCGYPRHRLAVLKGGADTHAGWRRAGHRRGNPSCG
ncbi:cation diffusion facilitator family transporter [Mesorhizobium sp. B2-6-1]|uniref:cation diffusion facilitator family transporter n=1 Tax=Mesorhizobium sp. B2-6-1 TaxID=2589916 RepID=UPI0032B23F05